LRQQQLEHAVSVGLREVLDGDRARVAAVELGQIAAAGGRELGCLDVPTEETDLDGKVSEGITHITFAFCTTWSMVTNQQKTKQLLRELCRVVKIQI
jgi:hypothetical protein